MPKKYEVEVSKKFSAVLLIEAENEEEAGKAALKQIQDIGAEGLPGTFFNDAVVSYAKEDIWW